MLNFIEREKTTQTFMRFDSGLSITGIVPFVVAEQSLRSKMFCSSSFEIKLQFLAFTFFNGTIRGAGIFQRMKNKVLLIYKKQITDEKEQQIIKIPKQKIRYLSNECDPPQLWLSNIQV